MPRQPSTWTASLIGLGAIAAYVLLPSILPSTAPKSQKRYTTGLANNGNDCFANATFQALASLSALEDFLATNDDTAKPWTSALGQAMTELSYEHSTQPRGRSVWPVLHVMERLYNARMSRAQQDAHELLLKMLELLEEEHKGTGIDLPFKGVVTDTIRCRRCGHTTNKNTDFLVLERMPGEPILRAEPELIEDYNCSECGPTVIEKTSRVSQAPRILAVHLNRSIYASANASFRSAKAAEVPLQLGLLNELQLSAVIYHHGRHDAGHYTAARRRRRVDDDSTQQPWWVADDVSVKPSTTRQVLARNTEAYMLFYERQARQANTTPTPTERVASAM